MIELKPTEPASIDEHLREIRKSLNWIYIGIVILPAWIMFAGYLAQKQPCDLDNEQSHVEREQKPEFPVGAHPLKGALEQSGVAGVVGSAAFGAASIFLPEQIAEQSGTDTDVSDFVIDITDPSPEGVAPSLFAAGDVHV